ncbi:class I SAM-dependent methyltransferase [Zobellia uliginosa]|nr:class I SAM-dependent methyltransferase [Zobellia uliginosa]MDO6518312.1 class I SAM-dependent methyltransferase [Zobellia uliginosa]
MNKNILNTGVQNFILKNLNTDIMSVLLKKPYFELVSNKELAEQLESRKKSAKKLNTWFSTSNIYYPNKLNIEQTSSEITARYKSEIVSGKSLVDLTGGFGVDSYFFSKRIDRVFHCEINKNLSEIASHNFEVLGTDNIETKAESGLEFIRNSERNFDWIYIDPSRRNDIKQRVFLLSDCQPDVIENLDLLFSKTEHILIKTAPLLDISAGINELKHIKEIHIVALNNEVKELLWVLERGFKGEVTVKTVNKTRLDDQRFSFGLEQERNCDSSFSLPLSYLYEPNAAILKSGAFKTIGHNYQLKKLQEHTHLYTSDELIDFPGRRFKIEKALPYNKKILKRNAIRKANITTRNFPDSVADIRKKLSIKDGGEHYIFFATNLEKKATVIIGSKV